MHTEMKYRFLIHYTLSFIGGYLGLYAIVSRADLFGNAQTANLLGVVRDLIGRDFSDMLLRVGALLIYMAAVILTVWIPDHHGHRDRRSHGRQNDGDADDHHCFCTFQVLDHAAAYQQQRNQ